MQTFSIMKILKRSINIVLARKRRELPMRSSVIMPPHTGRAFSSRAFDDGHFEALMLGNSLKILFRTNLLKLVIS